MTADRVHHVGMSVADIDAALAFWQAFLGVDARWRTVLDRPYLGRHVGYPGVSMDAAFLDLPGGTVLELLDYRVEGKAQLPDGTANPGNVHLCLEVSDAQESWRRAVECGARPLLEDGPVTVDAGPNEGARAAYLRIHDGITLELFQRPPSVTELRYERLHPAELAEAEPLAYLPIGTLEYHGEHLPAGVDSFAAHALCLRTAERSGGVVLPPVYLASGCLDLPFTLSFDMALVHAWVSATIDQLVLRGFRAIVVMTGHGPLDLNHLLKRVCAEGEERHPGLAAYGLCWLELNAARLEAPDEGVDPWTLDHAARIETSWMLELEPELVRLERLSADPQAEHVGIYGRNPRFTASVELGHDQIEHAADLLAERARGLLEGRRPEVLADLRKFVEFGWWERPLLGGRAGEEAALVLHNPGKSSRYVSSFAVELDATPIERERIVLVNRSTGETGHPLRAVELGPERGFYVRRNQDATIELGAPVEPGVHAVRVELGLGGVTTLVLDEDVHFH